MVSAQAAIRAYGCHHRLSGPPNSLETGNSNTMLFIIVFWAVMLRSPEPSAKRVRGLSTKRRVPSSNCPSYHPLLAGWMTMLVRLTHPRTSMESISACSGTRIEAILGLSLFSNSLSNWRLPRPYGSISLFHVIPSVLVIQAKFSGSCAWDFSGGTASKPAATIARNANFCRASCNFHRSGSVR